MLTISKLAKAYGVSRATVLYYEREKLLAPTLRGDNGYRWYGEQAVKKLQSILRFRAFGIPVSKIASLLDHDNDICQSEVLKAQFDKIEQQISDLRNQQGAIVALLQQPELLEKNMVTKERWVEIMKASGMSEEDMRNWHRNFEKMEPNEHQLFLESLGIEEAEIKCIRSL